MKLGRIAWFIYFLLVPVCFAQTTAEFQPVKQLKPTGTLGTCEYKPTDKEAPFYQKLEAKERVNGSIFDSYSLNKKQKKNVAWFGVVRGILDAKPDGTMTLLFEHKFFDGMTDCHIMLVSRGGGGDFRATLGPIEGTIVPLSLVGVYGTVDEEKDKIPHVVVQYVHVWPWMTFTFTDMGPHDMSNPAWAKYCKLCNGGRIYNPYPDKNYYELMLGNPQEFGTVPKTN